MNDLDQIKEILFGNEKKALNALVRRLETPESRTADVADVLPDAVTRSYTRDPRLGRALTTPIETTLNDAIRREPKQFADALFPVMGPAIRKAIAEALKSILQSINNAIDTSLSPTARFKAWRAGVPLAQWVLRENLVYRVDEVYLIDPRSGLLIIHLHHPDVIHKDEDAISAMLTAIQDFVRDSFTPHSGSGLNSVVIGEFTVWISQGPHAMLACVIRGVPPAGIKDQISVVNERLHLHHSSKLMNFDGSPGAVEGIDIELEELLRLQRRDDGEDDKRSLLSMPLLLVLAAIIATILFFVVRGWLTESKMDRLENLIQQSTGIIATDMTRDGDRILVTGLRDPLSADPLVLAQQAGVREDRLSLNFQPFQSLEPQMVELRARQILQAPDGVSLRMQADTLKVAGQASSAWRNRLMSLAPAISGISTIDTSALAEDDSSLESALRELLAPDQSTTISVTKGVAIFSGAAPLAWHAQLDTLRERVPGIVDVNTANLKIAEWVAIQDIRTQLNGRSLYYLGGLQPAAGQEIAIATTANLLRSYHQLATTLKQPTDVRVYGFADGSGTAQQNEVLRVQRANDYRDRLLRHGVEPQWLSVHLAEFPQENAKDLKMRRAELRLPELKK